MNRNQLDAQCIVNRTIYRDSLPAQVWKEWKEPVGRFFRIGDQTQAWVSLLRSQKDMKKCL